jgi:pimeloyl-ACP methyl ester carboxylesterase
MDYDFPEELYPFDDKCVQLGFGDYHYFDESPSSEPLGTVLMIHGNPMSSFLYRDVAQDLLDRGYRVIAPDHYGFGLSAKPSEAEFSYRPSEHVDVLVRFVDLLDLKGVTLVVQDWGGPLGLGMAVERPERIRNLTIMNTMGWQITEDDLTTQYHQVANWSVRNKQAQARLETSGIIVVGAVATLLGKYDKTSSALVRQGYYAPFFTDDGQTLRSPRVAAPANIFARNIIDDTALFTKLGTLEPLTDKPVAFYFGAADTLFGTLQQRDGTCSVGRSATDGSTTCVYEDGTGVMPYLERFESLWDADMITHREINPTAGHYVQDTAPADVARIVDELNQGA